MPCKALPATAVHTAFTRLGFTKFIKFPQIPNIKHFAFSVLYVLVFKFGLARINTLKQRLNFHLRVVILGLLL